jgi:hypothetical protein
VGQAAEGESVTVKNYRICFDLAGETPRAALIYLLGIIQDPGMQDTPFTWLVIDQADGYEYGIRCTLNELEREAKKHVDDCIRRLGMRS